MRVIRLCKGAGNGVDTACLMTATNIVMGRADSIDESELDRNECVCDLLRTFIVPTNDAMPDDLRSEYYGPLVWELLGTRTDCEYALIERGNRFNMFRRKFGQICDDCESPRCASFAAEAARLARDMWATLTRYNRHDRPRNWRTLRYKLAAESAQLIRDVAAIGDTRPVETVITHDELADRLARC